MAPAPGEVKLWTENVPRSVLPGEPTTPASKCEAPVPTTYSSEDDVTAKTTLGFAAQHAVGWVDRPERHPGQAPPSMHRRNRA
jgi:hypothetical protein